MDSKTGVLPAACGCPTGDGYVGEPVFAWGWGWDKIVVLDNLN